MKKTFVLEIECPPDWQNLGIEISEHVKLILWGELVTVYGRKKALTFPIQVKEIPVEQSVEPLKDQEKALDLLNRASDSLNYYCAELNGDMNDSLATEIEEYIGRNTKG